MASRFYNGGSKKIVDRAMLRNQTEYLMTHMYAAFVCELWDMGWTAEQIQELFDNTRDRWLDSTNNKWDIVQNVKDVTGIDVVYFMNKTKR